VRNPGPLGGRVAQLEVAQGSPPRERHAAGPDPTERKRDLPERSPPKRALSPTRHGASLAARVADDRRDHENLALRLDKAAFEEEQTLESFDWDARRE
jgi:hypothetical protein